MLFHRFVRAAFVAALLLPAAAPAADYAALGSSFAAGPGIESPSPGTPPRCNRSTNNYANQLARRAGLSLADASCSGARTTHLLEPWNELPAQLDAVTRDTKLVTITIGGNDVSYIGTLGAGSCARPGSAPCRPLPQVTEGDWQALAGNFRRVLAAARGRAPQARIVVVDYPPILPDEGLCEVAPLTPEAAAQARAIATRLAEVTAAAARDAKVELLQASELSRGHDACAAQPWMRGSPADAPAGYSPWHPTVDGMTAIAEELLRRRVHEPR